MKQDLVATEGASASRLPGSSASERGVTPDDSWQTGVFYESDAIWVSGLHKFGRACVKGTGISVAVIVGRHVHEASDHIDREYNLPEGTAARVLAEWRGKRSNAAIKRAERRAQDWCAGWWACNTRKEAT